MARKKRRRPSGQGCVYQRGPANFWIKWRSGGRVCTKGGYPTEDAARKVLDVRTADVRAGRDSMPINPKTAPTLKALGKDWLERREKTHRAWRDDRCRWRKHLEPFFGAYKPTDVDAASLRRFVERKLGEGLNPTTVGHCVRLFSTFFAEVIEQGHARVNPVSLLPRSTRRLYRSKHDTGNTPFLEKPSDVEQVFKALKEPYNVAFAVGALGGLRTGEVLGLSWQDVDLENRRIHVRQQVNDGRLAPLKDDDPRTVPLQNALAPILARWKLKTGGVGMLFVPACSTRGGTAKRPPTFMRPHTLRKNLEDALVTCKLPAISWYQATRHSFASMWVIEGNSLEKLSKILGHASVTTTERYAHLRPDHFKAGDYDAVRVNLSRPPADVVSISRQAPKDGPGSYAAVTGGEEGPRKVQVTA